MDFVGLQPFNVFMTFFIPLGVIYVRSHDIPVPGLAPVGMKGEGGSGMRL